jgi:hypothetical protein
MQLDQGSIRSFAANLVTEVQSNNIYAKILIEIAEGRIKCLTFPGLRNKSKKWQ